MIKKLKSKNKGFAILFAVLISSLLLAVGFSVYNISVKELVISNFEAGSRQAMYSAQSGMECALYWGFLPLSQIKDSFPRISTGSSRDFTCGIGNMGSKLIDGVTNPDYIKNTSPTSGPDISFLMYLSTAGDGGPCAQVYVTFTDTSTSSTPTKITSRGYNICNADNTRRVERVFESVW